MLLFSLADLGCIPAVSTQRAYLVARSDSFLSIPGLWNCVKQCCAKSFRVICSVIIYRQLTGHVWFQNRTYLLLPTGLVKQPNSDLQHKKNDGPKAAVRSITMNRKRRIHFAIYSYTLASNHGSTYCGNHLHLPITTLSIERSPI